MENDLKNYKMSLEQAYPRPFRTLYLPFDQFDECFTAVTSVISGAYPKRNDNVFFPGPTPKETDDLIDPLSLTCRIRLMVDRSNLLVYLYDRRKPTVKATFSYFVGSVHSVLCSGSEELMVLVFNNPSSIPVFDKYIWIIPRLEPDLSMTDSRVSTGEEIC